MKFTRFIAAAAIAAGVTTTAQAHVGPKLLTTADGERSAMTAGVTYADIDGVHLFKGRARSGAAPSALTLMGAPAAKATHVIVVHKAPWRSIRRLRTQGFYSGRGPASRAYTQGFYSGN